MQAWGRSARAAGQSVSVSAEMQPLICRTTDIDAAGLSVGVLVASPQSGRLAPLVSERSLAQLLGADAAAGLPMCGQE
jgi:hypothetical protein